MQLALLSSILLIGAVDGRGLANNIDHECKQNETLKVCTVSAEPSCKKPESIFVTAADVILNCNTDCQCADGFLRNPEGKCVKEEDCPYEDPKNKCKSVDCGDKHVCVIHKGRPVCSPKMYICQYRNELYQECGTKHEPSCENPTRLGRTDECFVGCQCERGFLRRSDGACVKPKDCHSTTVPKCPKNELYEKCGTKNEPSCENPKPVERSFDCVAGCQCEKGLLRRADNKCVKPIDCDTFVQECSKNESFESCGSGCEPSCDNQNPTNCSRECVSGCQCNKGFLRRGDKKCVKETQCETPGPQPTECPKNELLVDCNEEFQDKECPIWTEDGFPDQPQSFSGYFCVKRCACEEGLYKNSEGHCVQEADCRPLGYECKQNETFKVRGYGQGCEPSCRTPNEMCFDRPKPGCQCETGFFRNPEGECVKEEDCPYEDPENKCKSVECKGTDICLTHKGRPVCVGQFWLADLAVNGLFKHHSPATEGQECQENEIFTNCKTSCFETKCNEGPKACSDVCNGSGCVCQEGFFRDPFGVCMTENDCSKQKQKLDVILNGYLQVAVAGFS